MDANSTANPMAQIVDRDVNHEASIARPDGVPRQGLPDAADEPGGLARTHLVALLSAATGAGECAGPSMAIYARTRTPTAAGRGSLSGSSGRSRRNSAEPGDDLRDVSRLAVDGNLPRQESVDRRDSPGSR
jgi:hypothetical protein